MHHNVRLELTNSKRLKQRRISQYFLAYSQIREVLAQYIKNEIEVLKFYDCLDGPIYVRGIPSQLLWNSWREVQAKHQMPGWIATRFEDGQFWASRWEVDQLVMLGDFYPEINREMGFNCAGVFHLLSLVNCSLLMPCISQEMPGTDV